jgi:hypothetical protein
VGTTQGNVRVHLWPLNDTTLELEPVGGALKTFRYVFPEFYEIPLFPQPITSMSLSPDQMLLFAAGEDGSIFSIKLREVKKGADGEAKKSTRTLSGPRSMIRW